MLVPGTVLPPAWPGSHPIVMGFLHMGANKERVTLTASFSLIPVSTHRWGPQKSGGSRDQSLAAAAQIAVFFFIGEGRTLSSPPPPKSEGPPAHGVTPQLVFGVHGDSQTLGNAQPQGSEHPWGCSHLCPGGDRAAAPVSQPYLAPKAPLYSHRGTPQRSTHLHHLPVLSHFGGWELPQQKTKPKATSSLNPLH